MKLAKSSTKEKFYSVKTIFKTKKDLMKPCETTTDTREDLKRTERLKNRDKRLPEAVQSVPPGK